MADGSSTAGHVLITGGAGYIGSLLAGVLLNQGYSVTVVDDLLFGGESLLGYWHHPRFHFFKGDVCAEDMFRVQDSTISVGRLPPTHYDFVIHLAAIVGFPACQAIGRQASWRYNVEATQCVFQAAEASGAKRFVMASTYSNYGLSQDGSPVNEDSPLLPQSIYAETKIASEQFLLKAGATSRCAPIVYRFATLFGISPRTRFDLIVNQFVLEALTKHKLLIYQRGYSRSFVHVRDVCRAIELALKAPLANVRGQIFNVGSDDGNYTKAQIVDMVQRNVAGTEVEYKDLSFGGDMRDICVSFAKIHDILGFAPGMSVEDGICEVRDALADRLIWDPLDDRYRNAHFIVQ